MKTPEQRTERYFTVVYKLTDANVAKYLSNRDWITYVYADSMAELANLKELNAEPAATQVQAMLAAQAQPVTWPRNAAEVREFMDAHCQREERANDDSSPSDDDLYVLTAHDFLSAINSWADSPHHPGAAKPAQPRDDAVFVVWWSDHMPNSTEADAWAEWCALRSNQPAAQAQAAPVDADVRQDVKRLERERICAAIKAEDDYCVEHGDYMLDSDDCIKIVRGEWKRPDFAIAARAAERQP